MELQTVREKDENETDEHLEETDLSSRSSSQEEIFVVLQDVQEDSSNHSNSAKSDDEENSRSSGRMTGRVTEEEKVVAEDVESFPSPSSPKVKLTLEGVNLRQRLSSAGLNLDSDTIFSRSSTRLRYTQLQQPMLVLEVLNDGKHTFKDLKRDEVLQEARSAIPLLDPQKDVRYKEKLAELETLKRHVGGRITPIVENELVDRVRFKGTLQQRDIRILDRTFSHSNEPAVLVRRHAILVNLPPIKALLLHSRLLLFVPDGADSLLATLMTRLKDVTSFNNPDYREQHVPFVMRALEAILVTMCRTLDDEVTNLEPRVHQTVNEIMQKSSGVTIEKLRQSKSSVLQLSTRLLGIQHALEDLLQNDRDMALMKLDRVFAMPDFYVEKNADTWTADHEEVELLLENYAQAIDGTVARVEGLGSEIDSAMSTISLRLDTARNQLLGIDLLVTSVTSVAAVGALFAGLFGMNLDSGVQEEPYWFWTWFGAIVGGVPVAVMIIFYSIYRQGLLIT